jgi:sodium transport system permease protein
MRSAWVVFCKELIDALRDRRTLFVVLLSSVAIGPLALAVLSSLVGQLEERAASRVIVVQGIERAPSLRNFLERQTFQIEPAPAGFEQALRDSKLPDPVLVVNEGFEDTLLTGEVPVLELVTSSSNQRARAGTGRVRRLVDAFAQEQSQLRLAARGVAVGALEVVQLEERDVAGAGSRRAQMFSIVPFFVLMAMMYGALGAALDMTAGERERGSLEPLLMNPIRPLVLAIGKWAAVATVAMGVAVLGSFSFLPAQWLVRSETLSAMFQFGAWEACWFVLILLPLAGALSALLMAVAIRCRSFKEAQANSTVVLLVVSLVPSAGMLGMGGEEPWHLWVPALAQNALMGRVLRGEALQAEHLWMSALICAALAAVCLFYVSKVLRSAALK